MSTLTVRHRSGSYPVIIRRGLLRELGPTIERLLPGRRLAMITDRTVHRQVHPMIRATLLLVPPGERSKTDRQWMRLSDRLLALGFDRHSALVTVGGGVIGDLGGFVAATFLRGVPVVQVPTTLLAMVDASVGGKVGINTTRGKNLLGAFHPPAAVLVDPAVLRTLPERVYRSGLAEVVKHGLVADVRYYAMIRRNVAAIVQRDETTLARLIRGSVRIKARIVGADEHEEGVRATLNAGHTIAHAIETTSGYRTPHGEALSIGLVTEARLAEYLGIAEAGTATELRTLLAALGLPTALPGRCQPGSLLAAMWGDKKNRDGVIHFALPRRIGEMARVQGAWSVGVGDEIIMRALSRSVDGPK